MLVWAAATALSAAASVSFAAAQQGAERHRLTHAASYFFGLLGLAALFAVVGVAAGWFDLGLSRDLGVELGADRDRLLRAGADRQRRAGRGSGSGGSGVLG